MTKSLILGVHEGERDKTVYHLTESAKAFENQYENLLTKKLEL
jgi:hypothetical protein